MMKREEFKAWFTDLAVSLGVSGVEFRKLDIPTPFGPGLQVGNYNTKRRDIWVIEEWSDHFLPTEELIYYSIHELAHHLQSLRDGELELVEASKKDMGQVQLDADVIATIVAEPILGERRDPATQLGKRVVLPPKVKVLGYEI